VDTREKQSWNFDNSDLVEKTISQKLDTGDYAVEGLEHILCIERKQSVSEIAQNISQARFQDVLKRMKLFEHKFLLLEFDIDKILQFPVGSNVPKKIWGKLKVRGPYILRSLARIQVKYGVQVVFCGDSDNAKYVALNLMREVYEERNEDQ
jgi:hypothetical protein|tara:strand:+ start:399 stop:851 length:453 start_codon:yes stop_codon:yes gene_type:complete